MAKRLSKEELEKDPLIESFEKAHSYYEENRNLILFSAIAVILLAGLSIGYYYYSSTQEDKAQRLMTYPEQYYMNGEFEKALTGSEEEFTVGFEQIIDNYSGTDAANLARYYAAVCEFNIGNTEQALNYMNRYDVPEGIMGVGPLSFNAMLLTELGRHGEAADLYVKAAEWDENDSTTPYNYLEAAHAYHDAGDIENARTYAQKILNDYPDSQQVADASRLNGLLASISES